MKKVVGVLVIVGLLIIVPGIALAQAPPPPPPPTEQVTNLTLSAEPSSIGPGEASTLTAVITVIEGYPKEDRIITFEIVNGPSDAFLRSIIDGTVQEGPNVTAKTDENGVATAYLIAGNTPGIVEIKAYYGEVSNTTYVQIAVNYGVDVAANVTYQEVLPGETAVYTINVTNTGDVPDSYTLSVSNSAIATLQDLTTPTLNPGEVFTTQLSVVSDIPGVYTVKVTATSNTVPSVSDSVDVVTKVRSQVNISVVTFNVTPVVGIAPLTVIINATVTNTGDTAGDIAVYFYVNGSEIYNETISLNASETKYIVYEYTFEEAGIYNVSVNDLEPIEVKVMTLIEYYDKNNDGKISGLELLGAISDWRNDKITGLQLLQVIDAWRAS